MTKFEQIGIQLQNDSVSKFDAQKKFEYSCTTCCNRGIHLDCERCAIASTHAVTVAAFETIEANMTTDLVKKMVVKKK